MVDFFSAMGLDFMVIYLEFDPLIDPVPINWADGLLTANPDKRAILVTHGALLLTGAFSAQGQAIYDALKQHPNLFLILAGHSGGEARRTDSFNGIVVNTLMADYANRPNDGDGWLRILEFQPTNDQIQVRTYSPSLDQFETDSPVYKLGAYPHFRCILNIVHLDFWQ